MTLTFDDSHFTGGGGGGHRAALGQAVFRGFAVAESTQQPEATGLVLLPRAGKSCVI
jgi:hypothetical protein